MAEVLSHQEVNSNSDKTSQKKSESEQQNNKETLLFDFRLPNRISKNQLKILQNIHESFTESFASYLVSKLQSVITINITALDQIYYSEYVLSVANPACLYTFDIKNTDIKGILEFSPELALMLVDKLLGGPGVAAGPTKMITPIEQKVLKVVVDKIMKGMMTAWQSIDDFEFQLKGFESDIEFAQITSPNESVLLITFEIIVGEKKYLMKLCFATIAFDTILPKLSSQKLSAIRPIAYKGTTSREIISAHLFKTNLTVRIEFGTSKISMKNLIELEVGDIIKLDNKISDVQKVFVGDKILFYGKPGTLNKHRAIKITNKKFSNDQLE